MEKEIKCPYCGSTNLESMNDNRFICHECWCGFTEEDILRENIRHRLSAILFANNATEEKPLSFEHPLGEHREENCGLSSLNLPWITSIFEFEDGTIWFNVDGLADAVNFDDVETADLVDIITAIIKENLN